MENFDASNFRHLVRIYSTDLPGDEVIALALTRIKGISRRTSISLLRAVGIPESTRVGFLTNDQVERIEEALADPLAAGLPEWMLNRRNDPETGESTMLLESELLLQRKTDIDRMIRKRSWRGVRHSRGLKVRGQRTKSTGRKSGSLGVSRKKK
ncbi:MAG: 30S ribosomal protein S13 [Methanobacteriota archaeon]|nr:MAG: 30S ribosomal protein S13 [Euryarchaeota archaeon]